MNLEKFLTTKSRLGLTSFLAYVYLPMSIWAYDGGGGAISPMPPPSTPSTTNTPYPTPKSVQPLLSRPKKTTPAPAPSTPAPSAPAPSAPASSAPASSAPGVTSPTLEACDRLTRQDAQEILSVIENQLNAVQHEEYARAYNAYTAEQFREKTSLDNFIFFITSYPVFLKNKNAMFAGLEFKNNIASLEGILTSTDNRELKVDYFLTKAEGSWKIIGIKITKGEGELPTAVYTPTPLYNPTPLSTEPTVIPKTTAVFPQ